MFQNKRDGFTGFGRDNTLNTKTFQTRECAPNLDCPFSLLDPQYCVDIPYVGKPAFCYQDSVDAACARWAAMQPEVCVNLCHEVTYTVYLGGVYDWSFTAAPGDAGGFPQNDCACPLGPAWCKRPPNASDSRGVRPGSGDSDICCL